MPLKLLFVTATSEEADALRKTKGIVGVNSRYCYGSLEIELLIGGVGIVSTAWALARWISANEKPDIAINAGIAGSYLKDFPAGSVLMPVSDCFADTGIEDGDKFVTLFEAGLSGKNDFPFRDGYIWSENRFTLELSRILDPVSAITVNMATGSETTRNRLAEKYNPGIETMEGAAFFYICAKEGIPFFAVRSVSNIVERRNLKNWNIPLAIDNLALKLEDIFKILNK